MIDLTATNAADLMFVEITSQEPSPERSNMIRLFAKTYWQQLSEQYRRTYTRCYVNPERFDEISEAEQIAGEAAYNYGMAKQDREMMAY